MLYNLKRHTDEFRARRRFDDLIEQGAVIELKKKVKRSTSQNSYLHLILGWFAIETGYTLDEAKQIYKDKSVDIFKYQNNGKWFYKSSAKLTTEEMTNSIERFRNYASNSANIYLPEPSDLAFLTEIEIEMSKSKHL